MKYISCCGIFFIFFIACTRDQVYNDIIILEDRIIVLNDTFPINRQRMYNGKYSLELNGELYKEGCFTRSFLQGEWLYIINEGKKMQLNWQIYTDSTKKIKLSYPKGWESVQELNYPRLSIFYFGRDKFSATTKSDYFIISEYELKEEKTLQDFNKYLNSTIKKEYRADSDNFNFILEQEKVIYYNRYTFKDGENTSSIYSINRRLKNKVIEISMKVSNDLFVDNQLIFFELCRNLEVENHMIIPRLGNLEMEWNEDLNN